MKIFWVDFYAMAGAFFFDLGGYFVATSGVAAG